MIKLAHNPKWVNLSKIKLLKNLGGDFRYYSVHTQKFPKNLHFLPPDTHMYVWILRCKKCKISKIFCVFTKGLIT